MSTADLAVDGTWNQRCPVVFSDGSTVRRRDNPYPCADVRNFTAWDRIWLGLYGEQVARASGYGVSATRLAPIPQEASP